MLAVVVLSQHRVASCKTCRPRVPLGIWCMRHKDMTGSAVCSVAPHSQCGDGARPHLNMDEWKRPTPIRRRLSLDQDVLGRLIPCGLELTLGMTARTLEVLQVVRVPFMFHPLLYADVQSDKLSNSFHEAVTNGRLDQSLPWCASCCPTHRPCSTWSGS